MRESEAACARPTRRGALAWLAAPFAAGLGGCAAFDYRELDAPQALTDVPRLDPAPRLAVVLGSGGPRGYAHIGAIRVLEEAGIVPDLIVGSSVGSLVGTFWASGMAASRIDEISKEGGPLDVFDPSLFADRGWIKGERLQEFVEGSLARARLEALPRRMVVAATRRGDKQPRFFMSGNAGVAVRASSAMPGIVSPVGIAGVEYEDGDESLPVPVRAAISAGARFVIAIDVLPAPGSTPESASESLRRRDQRRSARIEPEVARADFLLRPDVPYWAGPFASYFKEARAAGEACARDALPRLRAALAARFENPKA